MSWKPGNNQGPKNNHAKLDWQKAREIRDALAQGETQGSQARKYGVAVNTIGKIARGEAWIDGPPRVRETSFPDNRSIPDSPGINQAAQDSLTRLLALGVPITKVDPQAKRGEGLLDKMLQEAGNDKAEQDKPEKALDKLVDK